MVNYSLSCDYLSLTGSMRATDAHHLYSQPHSLTCTMQDVLLTRGFLVDFDLPDTIRLPRLNTNIPFVQENGNPTLQAQQWWQSVAEAVEDAYAALAAAIEAIQAAYNAAAQAQTTATAAVATADAAEAAVATVEDEIADIVSGATPLTALNVGGQRYVTSGGTLIPEP